MKIVTVGLLVAMLGACTAQVSSGPGPRRGGPPPPPPGEPPPPASQPPPPVVQPQPGPVEERWVELAAPQRNDDNRDFIAIGPDQGRYRRIRLDVTRGSLTLRQVVVEFGNGENQKVRVDRSIVAGGPDSSLVIDLEGRNRVVQRILVYMDPAQARRDRGQYRLFGR